MKKKLLGILWIYPYKILLTENLYELWEIEPMQECAEDNFFPEGFLLKFYYIT